MTLGYALCNLQSRHIGCFILSINLKTMNKKIFLLGLFVILSTLSLNIKLGHLAGTKATFTLFDSFAPIAGQFLGTGIGLFPVIVLHLLYFLIHLSTHLLFRILL